MNFDLANIQAIGIGASAFIITLMAVFLLVFAFNDRTARAMLYAFIAATIWSWFGFLYSSAQDVEVARQLRVISTIGIVGLTSLFMNFAFVYVQEYRTLFSYERIIRAGMLGGAFLIAAALSFDFFGTRFFVGDLSAPPREILSPEPGPLLPIVILYHAAALCILSFILLRSIFSAPNAIVKRQSIVLWAGLTVGIFLGFPRWASWYGYDILAQLTIFAAPLLIVAALYAIKNYKLFNIRVAMAELLMFAIWAFVFVRIILTPTLSAALPDIILLAILLVLGVLLIRSILKEQQLAEELQVLALERTKNEFATIAAHQLRTPVAGIRWVFESIHETDTSNLTEPQRTLLGRGRDLSKHMARLITEFLDVTQLSVGKLVFKDAQFDMAHLIQTAVSAVREEAQNKHVSIEVHMPQPLPSYRGDEEKLGYALQNILDNAIKYSEEGAGAKISAFQKDSSLVIQVEDTGLGIDEKDREGVFQKFFRGEDARRRHTDGTGLGLFVTKSIIEAHRGSITLMSKGRHKGVMVEIHLPMHR